MVTATLTGLAQVFTGQGASALFDPISSEFGLSRAQASISSGIGGLVSGVIFSLAGWLSDKFGPKGVMVTGACIAGTGMVFLSFVTTPWAYFVVWGLIVAGVSLGFTVAVDTMLTNWFLRKRGLAFSIRFTITGLIPALMLPIVSWLIYTQGWRATSLIWGGVVFAGIPFTLYFVRQKQPEYYGLLPDGAKIKIGSEADPKTLMAEGLKYATSTQERSFTIRQIVRTPTYWVLTVTGVLRTVVYQGLSIHIIPFLIDIGISPLAASGMLAISSLFMIPSSFFGGIIADRVKKQYLKFLMAGTLVISALGIAAYLIVPTIIGVYIFLTLWGFGGGSFTPLDIVLRSRYFGRKAYGQQQGISMLFSTPVAFFAPIYTGWMHDITGSYTTPFTLFIVLASFSAIIICLVLIPKSPT